MTRTQPGIAATLARVGLLGTGTALPVRTRAAQATGPVRTDARSVMIPVSTDEGTVKLRRRLAAYFDDEPTAQISRIQVSP